MFGWFAKKQPATTADTENYESHFDRMKRETPIEYALISREPIGNSKHHYQLPDGASALVDHKTGRISINCKRPDGSYSQFASSQELRDQAVQALRGRHRFLTDLPMMDD